MKLLHILFICFLSTILFAQPRHTEQQKQDNNQKHSKQTNNLSAAAFPSGDQFKGANITYNIIPSANNTWGYDILLEGRVFIHQPSAPGLPGNEGFKTKEAAAKVAELAISKIKKGETPPSISIEEMKKLRVL